MKKILKKRMKTSPNSIRAYNCTSCSGSKLAPCCGSSDSSASADTGRFVIVGEYAPNAK